MKLLYAIESDLCLINPETLIDCTKDIVLPKYFYSQITHLSQGDFQVATDAATRILNSLINREQSDVLIFKTSTGRTVYFIDEVANCRSFDNPYENLNTTNLLDRYLLSLLKLSETLESKIVFIASSAEVIRKCRTLNFEVATLEEFSTPGESWLRREMLVEIQANRDDTISETEPLVTQEQVTVLEPEPSVQIEWRDIRLAEQISNIHWVQIT
jgi:hypothetical protein